MRVVRLSESCIIFKELSTDPAPIANSLNLSPPPGLIEAVPAFNQLAIYFEPNDFDTLALRDSVLNSSPLSVSVEKKLGDQIFDPNFEGTPPPPLGESLPRTRSGDLGGGHQNETICPNITPPSPDRESLPRTQSEAKGAFQIVPPSPDGEGQGWGDSSDLESAPPPPLREDLGGGIKNVAPYSLTTYSDSNLENLPQSPSAHSSKSEDPSLKIIPACYNGPDLEAVANTLNLTIEEFIQIHGQAIFTVEAIGFCPGFPYLAGLPQPLQNLPRKSTPRTAVEPGSIGITGDQCCIYPLVRPGGWNLIAQTPLTLVDPDSNYFPLQVGDKIQFQPISNSQFQQLKNKRL